VELADQVEALESVPEPFRRFYNEADGKWTLDDKGLTGAIGNYDRLLGEKKQAAARAKELQEKLKQFEGIDDPEEARRAASELQKLRDELAAKSVGTTDEEVEKLVQARYERVLADYDAKMAAKDKALKDNLAKLQTTEERLAHKAIDSEVSLAAATTTDFVPEAVEDAVIAARAIFQLEDGVAVPRTKDKQLMLGKDGENPLSIKEWLHSTKEKKPHWWKAGANGGGATGSDVSGGGKMMPRKQFLGMPTQRQAEFIRKGGTIVD